MLDEWRADGREIAVVGLGKSGVAAALLLREHGIPVYASDTGSGERFEGWAATLRAAGAAVTLGGHDLPRIARAGAVVVAPGVPPEVAPLEAARRAGVPIVAEVDMGLTALPETRVVAVTGTNGKTTTTSLIAHLMAGSGLNAEAAGNIGVPLCDLARRPPAGRPAWIALELSSFQLHDTPHLAPAVGVLTNLAPNHLDRYSSLDAYYGDKARLFANASASSVTVSNADDAAVQAMVARVPGSHRRFSVRDRADAWYDRPGRQLMVGNRAILSRDALPLLGDHNVANALTALLAVEAIGCDLQRAAAAIPSFPPIPHRVEPVREVDGVLWINDSKSTNVTSTEVAIAALDRPFVLLLGGRHKGEPYVRLAASLRASCQGVVAYGEARDQIVRELTGQVPVTPAGSFEEVVATARRLANPGDAVLLSPACSSYDMFNNYEERGARFRALVEAM
jgi:UDP-N-acetylmuramoylalanine--D-glutamate ligase